VVAAAALQRLRFHDHVAEILGTEVMLPQVGQGALAVECRAGDDELAALLATIEDRQTRRAVDAERAFLARLGGSCELPVGAYATDDGEGTMLLEAMIASLDGRTVLRDRARCTPVDLPERRAGPAELGDRLAERMLRDAGGATLLDRVTGEA